MSKTTRLNNGQNKSFLFFEYFHNQKEKLKNRRVRVYKPRREQRNTLVLARNRYLKFKWLQYMKLFMEIFDLYIKLHLRFTRNPMGAVICNETPSSGQRMNWKKNLSFSSNHWFGELATGKLLSPPIFFSSHP